MTFLLPGIVLAHSEGVLGHVHLWDVRAGWLHPFSGTDHLLAMLAVGLWAGQRSGRGVWTLPAIFMGCLLAGGCLAFAGATLPAEPVILASLLVLGLAIAASARLPEAVAVVAVGGFALFHGVAHGAEVPAQAAVATYALGFVLASAALHGIGVGLAVLLQRSGYAAMTRLTGAGIALTGAALLLG